MNHDWLQQYHPRLCMPLLLLILGACQPGGSNGSSNTSSRGDTISSPTSDLSLEDVTGLEKVGKMDIAFPDSIDRNPLISPLEQSLKDAGLVNVQEVDPSIRVWLAYSTEDNFLNTDVYGDLTRCYLQPEVAAMAAVASRCIQERDSMLRLIIFDGVRPRSVQRKMWDIVKGTPQQEYVAPPSGGGGMHNYGCAIDLGLFHIDSGLVDMGTAFDFFGKLAQPRFEVQFVQEGKLTQSHLDNRRALRVCMKQAGFSGILTEWWHFNAFPKEVVRSRYQIVE